VTPSARSRTLVITMRTRLLLPICLLTTLSCKGTYVLGEVLGQGGAGGSNGNPMGMAGASASGPSGNGGHSQSSGGQSASNGGEAASNGGSDTTGMIAGAGGLAPQFDCQRVASQQFDPNYMQAYSEPPAVTAAVNTLMSAMGPAQKATQMLGVPAGNMDYLDIQRSPDVQVAGVGTIRGFQYRDGDHGVNLDAGQVNRQSDGKDFSTAYPTPSVRAASWDLDLEKRIGRALGDETAAAKNSLLMAPNLDIVRHPYWGRTQEAYGEDTYQIGRMATAFIVGLQEYVPGCANHFTANNIEKNRALTDAVMNEQTLREIYARHFEMAVQDGGVACVMASYNKINGVKNTQNKHLLRDILKAPVAQGGMGFQGFVISDWWAMPGDQNVPDVPTAQALTTEAVTAGLDVELPWTLHYSTGTLAQSNASLVDQAARRVLAQKVRFKVAKDSDGWSLKPPTSTLSGSSIATNLDHEALAEEAEVKSAVLLANGTPTTPVLPLTSATNIAVVGPDREFSLVSSTVPRSCANAAMAPRGPCIFHFATDPALGDRGTNRVNPDPARTIGPFAGIASAAGASRQVTSGNSAAAAANADAVVVVVGYTPGDEGEEYPIAAGGDRASLNLPEGQNAFVDSILSLGKPTVIVIESGSIVNLPWLSHANKNQATIWAGYPGQRGGAALGKLIFGGANFSGKLPLAWPTQAELDLAPFTDSSSETRMGYFFGYREYDRRKAMGQAPDLIFPFGHGLSYSNFAYSNLTVPCQGVTKDAVIDISVDIHNTSAIDGDEVAMLFVKPPPKPAGITGDRPIKELKSFARVAVKAGQTVTAHLPLRIRDLRRWEGAENGTWRIDSGNYTLLVGKNAADAETAGNSATLPVQGD